MSTGTRRTGRSSRLDPAFRHLLRSVSSGPQHVAKPTVLDQCTMLTRDAFCIP